MKTLKKIRAQATNAKANLDAAILGLRNASLEQLMSKLEETKTRLEHEGDLAWNIASGVLAKVKAVRESLQAPRAAKKTKIRATKKAKPAAKVKVKATSKRLVIKTRGNKPLKAAAKLIKAKSTKHPVKVKKTSARKSKPEKRASR